MSWLALGVASYAAWAGVTIADKIVLSKWIKSSATYMITYGFIQLIALIGLPFFGFRMPSADQLLIALIVGCMTFYGYVLYGKALVVEEASRVAPLFQLGPVFTFLIAFFVVGERLAGNEILAFTLLIAGGFLVSVKRIKGAFMLSPALAIMPIATLLLALSAALTKYVFLQQGFWDGFVLMRVGFFFGALSLLSFKKFRRSSLSTVRALSNKAKAVVAANSLLDVGALVIWNYAVSLGPVSVIHALAGVTPLLVFIFALVLSLRAPRVLREEVTPKIVLLKICATALMIGGVAVLSVK